MRDTHRVCRARRCYNIVCSSGNALARYDARAEKKYQLHRRWKHSWQVLSQDLAKNNGGSHVCKPVGGLSAVILVILGCNMQVEERAAKIEYSNRGFGGRLGALQRHILIAQSQQKNWSHVRVDPVKTYLSFNVWSFVRVGDWPSMVDPLWGSSSTLFLSEALRHTLLQLAPRKCHQMDADSRLPRLKRHIANYLVRSYLIAIFKRSIKLDFGEPKTTGTQDGWNTSLEALKMWIQRVEITSWFLPLCPGHWW